ncbi:MAG: hypothetical protein HWD89_14985 [Tenacibaculum sp.]|uniref:hypothetical protein n=1 Tax=Tenacibaculum sp. TaxID=1906242 RepID=UPI0017DE3BE8|nr:hypothetical protein [Tenacibaculum sp.]NVK10354.1 hypothetical protein [Tenacibaculum sp.]
MGKTIKYIEVKKFISLIPDKNNTEKYFSWEKLNFLDLDSFKYVGNLKHQSFKEDEYDTRVNYWSENYPIELNSYPNANSEIYTDGHDYFMIYIDYGGHVPEKRCRLIRKELIVFNV